MNNVHHNSDFDEILEGERWLAGIATPTPSARALTSTKAAMQAEFLRLGRRSGGVVRWRVWHGVFAAAACITLCVTVGWQMDRKTGRLSPAEVANREVIWPQEVESQLIALGDIDEALTAIEAAVPTESNYAVDGSSLYDVLSEAVDGSESNQPAGSSMLRPNLSTNSTEDTI